MKLIRLGMTDIDTGSFTTSDPYDDIELLIPHAVNWQVKELPWAMVSGKELIPQADQDH
jgi:hypothetical protein